MYVYDIEVFPNVFHCAVKNTETGEYLFFEISSRRNDVEKLINFFWQIKEDQRGIWSSNYTTAKQFDTDKIFCGYNNIHYDNPVINFIIDHRDIVLQLPYDRICRKLFQFSNIIINSEIWRKNHG